MKIGDGKKNLNKKLKYIYTYIIVLADLKREEGVLKLKLSSSSKLKEIKFAGKNKKIFLKWKSDNQKFHYH